MFRHVENEDSIQQEVIQLGEFCKNSTKKQSFHNQLTKVNCIKSNNINKNKIKSINKHK